MNPFYLIPHTPKAYFCDRVKETEDILRFLENGSNVTLISPRRYGKTGLIYHIFDSLKEQKKKVELFYVDIYATSCVDDFIAVLAEAVSKELKKDQLVKSFFQKLGHIRPVISQDALSGEPKLSFAFQTDAQRRYSLKALLDFLEHRPTRVIVAIDEFQQIREYEGFSMEALLRTHIQPLTNVQFIFSGSKKHTMAEMFSSRPKTVLFTRAHRYTHWKRLTGRFMRVLSENNLPRRKNQSLRRLWTSSLTGRAAIRSTRSHCVTGYFRPSKKRPHWWMHLWLPMLF